MITMAGTALLYVAASVACSNGGDGEEPQSGPDADRSIRLSAGLWAVTRAAVESGVSFTASVGGWESAAGVDYAAAASWLSTASVTASESASGIELTPRRYYSQDGAVRTCVKAWYPQGTLEGGVVGFDGDPAYKGDGTDDILFAGEVSGSALDPVARVLAFGHLTTQLRFTVRGDALFGSTTTVKSITVKGTGVPAGLDLKTDALVYDASGSVAVPGIDGTQTITEQAALVGEAVMLPPFEGNTFRIDVQTSDVTYRDVLVTVQDDVRTLPGKAYTIALTFAGYEVTTQASVAEWDCTGTGSGDVTQD